MCFRIVFPTSMVSRGRVVHHNYCPLVDTNRYAPTPDITEARLAAGVPGADQVGRRVRGARPASPEG